MRGFLSDVRGTAAAEFALLALPFFFAIFAIVETSIGYAAQQLLQKSAERIAHELRVGTLKPGNTSIAVIRKKVCGDLGLFAVTDCDQIEIDLQTYPSFQDTIVPLKYTQSGDLDTGAFKVRPGGSNTINRLGLFYRWPFFTDIVRARLSNLPNGKTLLFASEVWRNEPY